MPTCTRQEGNKLEALFCAAGIRADRDARVRTHLSDVFPAGESGARDCAWIYQAALEEVPWCCRVFVEGPADGVWADGADSCCGGVGYAFH